MKGLRVSAFGPFNLQYQLLSHAACVLPGHIFAVCINDQKIHTWHTALARPIFPTISLGSAHLRNVKKNAWGVMGLENYF